MIFSNGPRLYAKSERTAHFDETSTFTGFVKLALCSLETLVVIVAENKYVVRSFGIAFKIWSIVGPKSMSNSLSASSIT